MTDAGRLLRNVSAAAALCAATALLAACGSARAGTADSAAGAVAPTHSASTGGTHTITQKSVDPKAWLIPKNVVSIRVIAQPGWGSTLPPVEKRPPARPLATVSDRSTVELVGHQLNTLDFGGVVPCGPGDGAYLELDFYSAGHPKSPSATAVVNHLGCNGVLLSAPGRPFLTHQGSVLDHVLKDLGLTFPTR
ncbi:hypothetical protein ABIA33_004955 [Streptacidiphilus sp. MAP12-16]|uniref:hypothetical protein n=1 Tax=Streptacidiphilus sp. MAP12-16 TaxID=3156300 RepID=UPI0035167062